MIKDFQSILNFSLITGVSQSFKINELECNSKLANFTPTFKFITEEAESLASINHTQYSQLVVYLATLTRPSPIFD